MAYTPRQLSVNFAALISKNEKNIDPCGIGIAIVCGSPG